MAKKRNKKGRKGEEKSKTEMRRLIVEMEKQKKQTTMLIASVIIIVVLAGIVAAFTLDLNDDSSSNPQNSKKIDQTVDDNITIPISEVDDGKIHYYTNEGKKFYVHKNPNGSYKTRISLCEPCDGKTFTLKEDGKIIDCDVCGTQWDSETYEGISGGCQDEPPPELKSVIKEGNIIIKKSDLK